MNHLHWLNDALEKSNYFIPHGHCYLWIPSLLWLHVGSDLLIGIAYLGISFILYLLVRKIRLPFSPVFIAFGLFIALCGLTHFMNIWTVWNPDYWIDGWLKAATAAASVATAIGLLYIRPQVEEVVHAARLSEDRRIRLESTNAELEALFKKVTELDELKTQFFANVSHELRTPLALILGPAERMLGDDNLTADQRHQLETIRRNSKALMKQVNDLLDVAKLEAGKMQMHYVRLDIPSWISRIASQFDGAAAQQQIAFTVSAPDSFAAEVDPEMLERILVNLLSNAFKFTPGQGSIHVELKKGNEEFVFSVSDSGPGIPNDQRSAVFERFRQVEGGATRRHGGTGLGLAIVKDFVDLHGGHVEVVSSASGGALFIVGLPLQAPQGKLVVEANQQTAPMNDALIDTALNELGGQVSFGDAVSSAASDPHKPTVLVVEDNPDMSRFITDTLSLPYNVVRARDGQEGLEQAQALKPDLIVTDIMMPRMSGDQLVQALRAQEEFNATPILLLTAKADDELRIRLLRSGAQDYLSKPFLPQELLARTANLVAAKRSIDAMQSELASTSNDLEGLAKELALKHHQLRFALEATELAREQAESANRVKGEFLALVSHELRTPLSVIDMNAQLLASSKVAESDVPVVGTSLTRLARATQQMTTLVEGLLQYTRLESGKLHVRPEPIDAGMLAEEVIAAHAAVGLPDVKLVCSVQSPLPPLTSDMRLLRAILSNLVSNALKFTQAGTVELRIAADGPRHVFAVHDTGIGIREEDLERIFLPFEQLEPVRRKSIPGMGLGLSLVKQLVEALQGEIEVKSVPGTGSTFAVYLPNLSIKND